MSVRVTNIICRIDEQVSDSLNRRAETQQSRGLVHGNPVRRAVTLAKACGRALLCPEAGCLEGFHETQKGTDGVKNESRLRLVD